jgi:invasion protein IalB
MVKNPHEDLGGKRSRGMLMTHKMRSAWVVSASPRAGSAIAGAILSVAIIYCGPATAAEPWPNTPSELQKLIYSPWIKLCGKGNYPYAKEVCATGKGARTEAGQMVMAALIEPEGQPNKLFRVILPSPLELRYGTRIIIDKEPPISSTSFACSAIGCKADYEATPELVNKLKKGRMLQIQAINHAAAVITFLLPLVDSSRNRFAGANEGPAIDPKAFEKQQTKQGKRCDPMTLYWCRVLSDF